jgi:hypothetical protein
MLVALNDTFSTTPKTITYEKNYRCSTFSVHYHLLFKM